MRLIILKIRSIGMESSNSTFFAIRIINHFHLGKTKNIAPPKSSFFSSSSCEQSRCRPKSMKYLSAGKIFWDLQVSISASGNGILLDQPKTRMELWGLQKYLGQLTLPYRMGKQSAFIYVPTILVPLFGHQANMACMDPQYIFSR